MPSFFCAGDRSAGKFYPFTMSAVRPPTQYKRVDDLGRQGLYEAIVAAYAAVFPAMHSCHGGPAYGVVVRELHKTSLIFGQRLHHLHAGCAFVAHHRWKLVEQHLREKQQIKVPGSRKPRVIEFSVYKNKRAVLGRKTTFSLRKTILL